MPNVLVIYTDNMRYDQLAYCPQVRRFLCANGVTFTQARSNVALCNPSRANYLLGQWAAHSGYNAQGSDQNVLLGLDLDDQLAHWLDLEGVRCGMFGKPWNPDDVYHPHPDGWATWRHLVLFGQASGDLGFTIDNGTSSSTPAGHVHDYFLDQLETFVAGSEPWFAHYAPHTPHAPYAGALDDLFAFTGVRKVPVWLDDASLAPSWIGASDGLTPAQLAEVQGEYRRQVRELAVLDASLGLLFDSIDLTDTVVLFSSDNGAYHGEHRSTGLAYNDLYDGALRVACVAAGPGFEPGTTSAGLVSIGADLTRTALAVFDAEDRVSHGALSGIDLRDPIPTDRQVLAERNGNIGPVVGKLHSHDGQAIITSVGDPLGQRKLIRWFDTADPSADRLEAYDLSTDPEELDNWAGDPVRAAARADELVQLEADLQALVLGP